MNLLIDIGNTRIKWATGAGGAFEETGELVHRGQDLAGVLEFLGQFDAIPAAVRGANVAGAATGQAIADAVRARWNLSIEFARTQASAGPVRNGYHDHGQMGVDRWLAILAAYERYHQPICVVDVGTAVTIDQVDGTGVHLGGLIVPGLDLMKRALISDTGDIAGQVGADHKVSGAENLGLGRSTAEAIDGGTLAAICGLIERCREELSHRYGDTVLVLTGGDAERIMPHISTPLEHRPLLVLEGLMIYAPD
jgi:type III pantothenate kinase